MWFSEIGGDLHATDASGIGEVEPLMEECDTGWGRMARLRPALAMADTPPRWSLPSAPPGSHEPSWS
jgi:hypothetical protein